jgi:acyl-CoA synthetase (AMP-forming)/AMP-acid ligase II
MLVSDIVRRNAQFFPERDAVVTPSGVRRTWAEVDERTSRLANALLDLGLEKGDRLAIYAPNCPEYIDFFFGTAKSGIVGAATNIRLSGYELASYHEYVQPRAVLVHADLVEQAQEWIPKVPSLEHAIGIGEGHGLDLDLESLVSAASPIDPNPDLADSDVYQLGATSGTTGIPKAAILTHRNAVAAIVSWAAEMPVPECGTALQNIPMFFNPGGPSGLHPVLLKGGRTVIPPAFDPAEFPRLVEEYHVTNTIIVPTMVQMVVSTPGADKFDMSSLCGVMSGGSPMSTTVLKKAREIIGDVFYPIYGMAESYSVGTILRPENQFTEGTPEQVARLSSVGKPYVLTRLRVVDPTGQDVPHDGTTSGEIWMSGDTMSPGYYRMPEETEACREGEWFKTGDVAVVDSEGFITIVDRLKDMIITGGINVFSIEVERCLQQHPGVEQVAVIGVPSEQWGEAIHAIVQLKQDSSVSEQELLDFAAARLSGFKKPRSIEFLPALPISATGKILKKVLRAERTRA